MALAFAAVVPHSPLLVPNIGKENVSRFVTTLPALSTAAEELKAAAPDAIIILTAHGPKRERGFVANLSPRFTSDLSAFGDLVSRFDFTGSISLPARLRERLEGTASLMLTTYEGLDYAASIALSLLAVNEKTPILPLSAGGLDLANHTVFGQNLRDFILSEDSNIAVIAAADFSHRLSKQSPAGYSAKAKKLDQKIVELITANNQKEICALSSEALNDAAVEDMGAVAILLGVLDGFNWPGRTLSYEYPFGVGHAVITFRPEA